MGLQRYAVLAARLLGAAAGYGWVASDAGLLGLGALTRREGVLVVDDVRRDPRTSARTAEAAAVGIGSFLGVVVRDEPGDVVGVLGVSAPEPRTWTDRLTLLQDIAAVAAHDDLAVDVEEVLRSDRLRRQLGLGLAGIGQWGLDPSTGTGQWDDRMLEIFGLDRDALSGSLAGLLEVVHPDDRVGMQTSLEQAIRTTGEFDHEFRIRRPDGRQRWVRSRGRVLLDARGAPQVVGASFDTTELRDSLGLHRVLETIPAPFVQFDHDWRFRYLNAAAQKVMRRPSAELLGRSVWAEFPYLLGGELEAAYRRALAEDVPVDLEVELRPGTGEWTEVRAWPDPGGLSVFFTEITPRRTAQREAQEANRRLRLLAAVTADLSSTLDLTAAVDRFAQHLVPSLGDWCVVSLLDHQDELHDAGWTHADPLRQPHLARYVELRAGPLASREGRLRGVLQIQEPLRIPHPVDEALLEALGTGSAREAGATAVAELETASAVLLPLRARQRTVGLVTVARGRDRPELTADEVQLIRDLAGAAGLAIENARLYGLQQRIAESLQRNLLQAPAVTEQLEVTVRYAPAAEAVQVGGDWYDVFRQPDGATVLVIGDVMGHDVDAAGSMGELRSLLRATAWATGAGPADLLAQLDQTLYGLRQDVIATVLVARLEVVDGRHRLRWSNAGHPPMVRLAVDGSVEVIDGFEVAAEPDLLLGIDSRVARTETVLDLDDGDVVLMFTDGLVERRDQAVDEGLERLAATVETLVESGITDLDQLCDTLLARMLPDRPEDDVALVAVRLLPAPAP